jgi:glutathione synthase/RimK-type ligase-like ATP-grasp enzyme
MKTLLVLYAHDDFDKETPFEVDFQLQDNISFYQYALNQNIRVVRSSVESYNLVEKCFDKYWSFDDGRWQKHFQSVTPDAIWDKAWEDVGTDNNFQTFPLLCEIYKNFNYVNNPYFSLLLRNKFYQYQLLPEFLPTSAHVFGRDEVRRALQDWQEDRVVIKPLYGSGGNRIYIGKTDFEAVDNFYQEKISSPLILQRFIKVEPIDGRLRDYRLVYVKNKLVYTLSRVALSGSLFTNISQGAEKKHFDPADLDSNLMKIATQIQQKMSLWQNTIYSLDFMEGEDHSYYLIEVNTIPNLSYVEGQEEYFTKYYDAILDFVPKDNED